MKVDNNGVSDWSGDSSYSWEKAYRLKSKATDRPAKFTTAPAAVDRMAWRSKTVNPKYNALLSINMKWSTKYGDGLYVILAIAYFLTRESNGSRLQEITDIFVVIALTLIAISYLWNWWQRR